MAPAAPRRLAGPPPIGGETIEFDEAPTAVQNGLDSLASTDGLTAPTSTQSVYLSNNNGVEAYSVDLTSSGKNTKLTVDVDGNAITAPTKSTTAFGAITNSVVTSEFNSIAAALGLTAPSSTTNVSVVTNSGGTSVYTLHLTSSNSTPWGGRTFSVDSSGNPVGNETLPFSILRTTIQDGPIDAAPSGVSLSSSSTQNVFISTVDGVTLYTMAFTSTGTRTTITVNSAGDLHEPPQRNLHNLRRRPLCRRGGIANPRHRRRHFDHNRLHAKNPRIFRTERPHGLFRHPQKFREPAGDHFRR